MKISTRRDRPQQPRARNRPEREVSAQKCNYGPHGRWEADAVAALLPIRPFWPTANGNESAFQFWSASGDSPALGFSGTQVRPSSRETSVPVGPTASQL